MNVEQELACLRREIGALWQRRERLKVELSRAADRDSRRPIFMELERLDRELSELDSRFKALWNRGTVKN